MMAFGAAHGERQRAWEHCGGGWWVSGRTCDLTWACWTTGTAWT